MAAIAKHTGSLTLSLGIYGNFVFSSTSLKLLNQFLPNFCEMILGRFPLKFCSVLPANQFDFGGNQTFKMAVTAKLGLTLDLFEIVLKTFSCLKKSFLCEWSLDGPLHQVYSSLL